MKWCILRAVSTKYCFHKDGMFQRPHGIPGWTLLERVQEKDLPARKHREEAPNDDAVLLPQLVGIPVLLDGEVLAVRLLPPGGRGAGQAEDLPLVPELGVQPLNERLGHLAGRASASAMGYYLTIVRLLPTQ